MLTVLLATIASSALSGREGFHWLVPRERKIAPDFVARNLKGEAIGLEQFRGRVVLINFWATWCVPCIEEYPQLIGLQKMLERDGLIVITLAADKNTSMMRRLAQSSGSGFYSLFDEDEQVARKYLVKALPVSYIIGRDGRFSGKFIGSQQWDDPGMIERIRAELNKTITADSKINSISANATLSAKTKVIR